MDQYSDKLKKHIKEHVHDAAYCEMLSSGSLDYEPFSLQVVHSPPTLITIFPSWCIPINKTSLVFVDSKFTYLSFSHIYS